MVAQTVKNLLAKQETHNPSVRRIPWGKEWLSTSVFLSREFHGQRSLEGCTPWGNKELDVTEQLNTT